jgi:hypothetical protein
MGLCSAVIFTILVYSQYYYAWKRGVSMAIEDKSITEYELLTLFVAA